MYQKLYFMIKENYFGFKNIVVAVVLDYHTMFKMSYPNKFGKVGITFYLLITNLDNLV